MGPGLGTALVTEIVRDIRQTHPHAGILADPDADNLASRRVLEHNGFELLGIRQVASEPTDAPVAIYRLAPLRPDAHDL